MKKKVMGNDVYYTLAWSPVYKYDKHRASRIIPEMPGIVCLMYREASRYNYILFYSCWRDGCRMGIKKLLDPFLTNIPSVTSSIEESELYFKYTVVEGPIPDFNDILYWLINTYQPLYNNTETFKDSRRYRNIHVKELKKKEGEVIEKIPGRF